MPTFRPSAPVGMRAGSSGSYSITPMSQSMSATLMRNTVSVSEYGMSGVASTSSDAWTISARSIRSGGSKGVAMVN